MTEAIVEHAAFAVVACPDHSKIPVRSLHALAGQFEFVRIETQQDTHILSRKILDLVNLVLELESGGEILHSRKRRIFNQERCVERPTDAVEIPPSISLLGQPVNAWRAVDANGFSIVANKGEQVAATMHPCRDRVREEDHGVKRVEVLGLPFQGLSVMAVQSVRR
jgi:hypothetical protein